MEYTLARVAERSKEYTPESCHCCIQRASMPSMLGASGTVTTVSAHHLGLKRYSRTAVDGSRIARDSILKICDKLAELSVAELTSLPCIGDDRADLALAGGAILEAVCRQWPAPMVRVADRGLREGILMDLMRQADRDADPLCAKGQ